jgi:hypothetical protein
MSTGSGRAVDEPTVPAGRHPLFVSALYLVGDQHGNMPATVECPPYV